MRIGVVFISIITLFSMASCTTAKPIVGPDGTEHQLITCDDIETCYSKAAEVCGGKYAIANSSTETSGWGGVTGTEYKLLVKCDK